ncbi:hypothetical protein G9A89_001712 [Geosiphon pyriformis]|nr:hypothetical protein G9A89_001712 [Geosiphon pyriformis]
MIKKTKSSEKWEQSLVSAIVTPNSFVIPNEILDEIFIASSSTSSKMGQDQPLTVLSNMVSSGKLSPVVEAKQSPSVGSPVLGNWADQMETDSSPPLIKLVYVKTVFQSVHGFLGAKSVLKDNVKLFCMEFASQQSLEAAFLVELTSSVHLTTLKIAKSLVVSESGSSPAVVALRDVPLDVSAADVNCTTFEISDMISQIGGRTCFIPYSPNSGCCSQFALVTFEFQGDLDSAVVKTGTLRKCHIWWETSGCWHCFRCQKMGHLAVDCKIFLPPTLKVPKVFKSHFVGGVSYAKASASLDSSEFPPLAASTSPSMVVGDFLVSSWLASLESDLVKLSTLVESIVKPVGFLVKLFEQFINGDLVLSSKLGLKVNEVMVYMGSFSKIVSKLGREVVSLKKKCCMEDIDMSGDSEHPVDLNDEVFSNLLSLWEHKPIDVKTDVLKTAEWLVGLVSCSATLFFVIQKMSFLGKFSSSASM